MKINKQILHANIENIRIFYTKSNISLINDRMQIQLKKK
jgi:hypothetical protein